TSAIAAAVYRAHNKAVIRRWVQRIEIVFHASDRVAGTGRIGFLQSKYVDAPCVARRRFVADGTEDCLEGVVAGRVVRIVERVPIDDPHDGEQIASLKLFKQ